MIIIVIIVVFAYLRGICVVAGQHQADQQRVDVSIVVFVIFVDIILFIISRPNVGDDQKSYIFVFCLYVAIDAN